MIKFIFPAVLTAMGSAVFAQTEKMETDRPDQTECPYTVPKKCVQFEAGFLKMTEKEAGNNNYHFHHPALLSKYGISNKLELRVITELATSKEKMQTGKYDNQTGFSSLQLGGKISLWEEKGLLPKTSLIAHYDFCRWRSLERDGMNGANFRFTLQNSISKNISLGYNLGMRWERFDEAPAYVYTFAPGFNLSEKWYAYIELFGFVWQHNSPENSIDGGFAYNVTNNFKLDISGGIGLTEKAPGNYVAIGASVRFKAMQ